MNITSKLYTLDTNGAYGMVELNLQSKTNSGNPNDKAALP